MSWQYYNPNPSGLDGVDCSVRALTKALDVPWEKAYVMLAANGFMMNDVMSANHVFNATLRQNGFNRNVLPNTCPDCYTINDFAKDHPRGTYVVGTGDHVCVVENGTIFDSWQSGGRVLSLYWSKEEQKG